MGQTNENYNNKNRKYEVADKRIRDTYVRESRATLRRQLYDPYVRFFRWATDRLEGRDGVAFLDYGTIKWSRNLKRCLTQHEYIQFDPAKIRAAVYRPFTKQWFYFSDTIVDELGTLPSIFPATLEPQRHNCVLWLKTDCEWPMFALLANQPFDLLPQGGSRGFPFYVYDEDGTGRRENITDWAPNQFRSHYKDESIDKWAIFHYVYGLLHHGGYREKFADNLKRELPRIPFAPDFRAFADAGRRLAALHLDYEKLDPWDLEYVETPGVPLSYRVEDKMRLSKDKTRLAVNPSLTLAGIPPEALEYRLGNRSALEWVVDQYQVSTDKRSAVTSDPNREDDPKYIVRLVGQVVRVSVETMKTVKGLPEAFA